MSSNDYRTLEAKERPNLIARNYKHWAITLLVVIFCLLPTSSTFGYAYYSDTWMDDSDPANIRIIGTGVTSDSNNGYMGYYPGGYGAIYHSYWVQTTLTSPDGRTVTVNSYHSSSYTSAETSFPVIDGDNFDLGDYSGGPRTGRVVRLWRQTKDSNVKNTFRANCVFDFSCNCPQAGLN